MRAVPFLLFGPELPLATRRGQTFAGADPAEVLNARRAEGDSAISARDHLSQPYS